MAEAHSATGRTSEGDVLSSESPFSGTPPNWFGRMHFTRAAERGVMTAEVDDSPVTEIEVAGTVVAAVTAGVEQFSRDTRESAKAILRTRNLDAPDPEAWYPLADYVAAIEALTELVGDYAVHALGQRLARVVEFPAAAEDVPTALHALEEVYRGQHRGGDSGGYEFRQIGAEDGRIECQTPYPCAFDRGIVEGAAVAHADGFVCVSEVGACQTDEQGRCTYDVSW